MKLFQYCLLQSPRLLPLLITSRADFLDYGASLTATSFELACDTPRYQAEAATSFDSGCGVLGRMSKVCRIFRRSERENDLIDSSQYRFAGDFAAKSSVKFRLRVSE